MNFLDKLVIPSTANHIALLKYMLTIALLIFIPYISMQIGSLGLSLFFKAARKKKNNSDYLKFSDDIFTKLTLNKWAVLGLGVVPLLSITVSYSQLLYQSRTIAVSVLFLSLALYVVGFVFLSLAKSKFGKGRILSFILFLAATFVFCGFSSFASDTTRWITGNKMMSVIFSLSSVINFVYFLAITGAITGAAVLFFFFKWNDGLENLNDEYAKFVKTFSGTLAIMSVITLPVVLLFNFIFLPDSTLSSSVFTYAIVLLIFTTLICSFLYSIIRDSDAKYAGAVIMLLFIIITFNILKDQMAFANGIKDRIEFIISKGDEHEQQKKSKVISTTGIDGELIYNQRCASCHKFDQKVVGPPHKDVVPKYKGDVKKLAEFIMNPTKVDSAYPPMPNPGLKQKEATAVADYLIKKLGK